MFAKSTKNNELSSTGFSGFLVIQKLETIEKLKKNLTLPCNRSVHQHRIVPNS